MTYPHLLPRTPLESCTVAPRERANCGYSGITPAVCKAKGCCFDNTVSGVPWCFRPVSANKAPEEGRATARLWGLEM